MMSVAAVCAPTSTLKMRRMIDLVKQEMLNASSHSKTDKSKPPCIVLDIDDTVIKSTKQCRVIRELLEIYKFAQALKMRIFIVTARIEDPDDTGPAPVESPRDATIKHLEDAGIDRFDQLFMMPRRVFETHKDWSKFKYDVRAKIATDHEIIVNAGDSWTDLMLSEKYEPSEKIRLNNLLSQKTVAAHEYAFLKGCKFARWSIKLPNTRQ